MQPPHKPNNHKNREKKEPKFAEQFRELKMMISECALNFLRVFLCLCARGFFLWSRFDFIDGDRRLSSRNIVHFWISLHSLWIRHSTKNNKRAREQDSLRRQNLWKCHLYLNLYGIGYAMAFIHVLDCVGGSEIKFWVRWINSVSSASRTHNLFEFRIMCLYAVCIRNHKITHLLGRK